MREWQQTDFAAMVSERPLAVYLYSPWCGTCHLAEKMLRIVVESWGLPEAEQPIVKVNAQFAPRLLYDWQVESVPCLIILQGQQVITKLYRFSSVVHVHEWLATHLNTKGSEEDGAKED